MEPREIEPSRVKAVLFLLISLLFVAVGLFVPFGPDGQFWRWACLLFFGFLAAVFAVLLVRPTRLLLDAEGFTVTGGLARAARRTAWADVAEPGFELFNMGRRNLMVGYDLVKAGAPDPLAMAFPARRIAPDKVLPGTLKGSAPSLAAELNAYRAAALGLRARPGSPPNPGK